MSDATLSPSSIVRLLRFKWASQSKQSISRSISKGSNEFELEVESAENHDDKESPQKEHLEVATLSHLDTTPEHDSTHSRCSKGILKDPKNSIVMKIKAKGESVKMISSTPQSTQNIALFSENLTESKIKKVTFSVETKNNQVTKHRRVRITKKMMSESHNHDDYQNVEGSSTNNLTPMALFETHSSPRNVFKIKTPRSGKNIRCAFNVNVPGAKPSDELDDNTNNKYLLRVPSFEKGFDFESPVRALPLPSLQTVLEESPIYPGASSSDAHSGSLSARNSAPKISWNVQFDRENHGSLTPREGQVKSRVQREKNLDYFAELQRKAPLILPNKPSRPSSKTASRPSSKSGAHENVFIISRRDFRA